MNEVVRRLRAKGYTVGEFLLIINRGSTWWNTHKCHESKDYALLMLAVKGLEDKLQMDRQR